MRRDELWVWLGRSADVLQVLSVVPSVVVALVAWDKAPRIAAPLIVGGLLVAVLLVRAIRNGLSDTKTRRRVARLLLVCAETATHELLNNRSKADYSTLRVRMDAWQERVLRLMDSLAPYVRETDKSKFRTLVVYEPAGLGGEDEGHAKLRNILAEKILRLREIARGVESV